MKRKNLVRTIIVIVILLWSGWKLYPTVRLNTLSMEQREKLQEKGKLVELQNNAIKRGLDLQGGMYLVLRMRNSIRFWKRPDAIFWLIPKRIF